MKTNSILILNFGSQYNQLIARRIREIGVYAEVVPYNISINDILIRSPKGIILSGSPSSVLNKKGFFISKNIFELNIPILGICYGMQLICHIFNGLVIKGKNGEYGSSTFIINDNKDLLIKDVPNKSIVWMSHFDQIYKIPKKFKITGYTENCIASISYKEKNIYALQFHPEVSQTIYGILIFKNFVYNICLCKKNWKLKNFISDSIFNIKKIVKNENVILGLSGGIDSLVTAILIHQSIGKALNCIFINTGLLRIYKIERFINSYKTKFKLNIYYINAEEKFLSVLNGISNPEEKRKIIGKEFIYIFQKAAKKIINATFLAQGTIYTDIIESLSPINSSFTIKSHHNVGGLPKNMKLKLLEPIKYLFKDEVRKIGISLGIPKEIIYKHPFPGTGLAIRICGKINKKKLNILRLADNIFIEELKKNKLYEKVDQAFAILLPVKSVGIMGDIRTHEYTIILRSVNTQDFMTATWSHLPYNFLENVSKRIINEVKGINRVAYDISSKPPSTIEWE